MKRALIVAALVFPATAHAETATISMPGKSFSPARLTVFAGDSVLWRNGDLTAHDVKGGDFRSGALASSSFFTHEFGAVGPQPFLCTIHPFTTGEVDVVAATLSAASVFAGEAATLSGRAPAGTPAVQIVRADGAVEARATPAADGTFSATVKPAATAVYVARTGSGDSPAATVTVTETFDLRVRQSGRTVRVSARPRLIATLQVYDRWHFDWRGAGHVRLDGKGRGTIVHRGAGRARIVISRTPRGAPIKVGAAFRLK